MTDADRRRPTSGTGSTPSCASAAAGRPRTRCGWSKAGLNVITLPKTIDNDVAETDATFGFATALEIATEAIDRLHSTAHSHHRIIVAEVMGHRAGWLTLGAGIAGGADVILIPEIPYRVESVVDGDPAADRRGHELQHRRRGRGRPRRRGRTRRYRGRGRPARGRGPGAAERDARGRGDRARSTPQHTGQHAAPGPPARAAHRPRVAGLDPGLRPARRHALADRPAAGRRASATPAPTSWPAGTFGVMVAARGDGHAAGAARGGRRAAEDGAARPLPGRDGAPRRDLPGRLGPGRGARHGSRDSATSQGCSSAPDLGPDSVDSGAQPVRSSPDLTRARFRGLSAHRAGATAVAIVRGADRQPPRGRRRDQNAPPAPPLSLTVPSPTSTSRGSPRSARSRFAYSRLPLAPGATSERAGTTWLL